ncbi:MAG TPA: hypothetical protein VK169_14470 [Saprospiraceae bacterium]|nr:hypothetical protein [Saprospiraceae bacterium]
MIIKVIDSRIVRTQYYTKYLITSFDVILFFTNQLLLDEPISKFMKIFYIDLFKNKNIKTAFQKAQKDMKKKYPNEPWMWGGFVLVR